MPSVRRHSAAGGQLCYPRGGLKSGVLVIGDVLVIIGIIAEIGTFLPTRLGKATSKDQHVPTRRIERSDERR